MIHILFPLKKVIETVVNKYPSREGLTSSKEHHIENLLLSCLFISAVSILSVLLLLVY